VGVAGLFLVAFSLEMGPWKSTRPIVDWLAKAEVLTPDAAAVARWDQEKSGPKPVLGWAAFPPCRFHPDNVGEGGAAPASRSLKRPAWPNLLGCDMNGRDVLARLLFGTRISLTIGLVAVAIFIAIGCVLGSLAGYYGRKTDLAVMRLVEVMLCFPQIFLILTIVAVFETRSIFLIMGVIGVVGWPGVTRLVRAEFLRNRNLDYVVAARALGVPERRVIFGHVFPNCLGPVLVSATFGIASAILTESGLAFLGLGDSTAVSWGQMLNSGRSEGQWHLIYAPGAAIFFVVVVFNLLGEGLRDALDPKLRR
jgi:peptide/nickel transport system permease protein